jgi:four helix bundle protein
MGDFKQLRAWKQAQFVAVLSKAAIAKLPRAEEFGLADQWKRASYSVALNIAEGASRYGAREFRRYLDIARASLHEIEAIVELVVVLGYLKEEDVSEVRAARATCARMVFGLLSKMSEAAKRQRR